MKVTKPETIRFRLTGIAPLIMHAGRLADPLDPATKALKEYTSKRKKTDEDLAQMARLEWIGGLYLDENNLPCIPSDNIEAMLAAAASAQRLKKVFSAGVFSEGLFPVIYKGVKDIDKMWECGDYRLTVGCKLNGKVRIMRTRPIFKEWSIECNVSYFPQAVDKQNIIDAMDHAGVFVGLGDWRPRYGRFTAEII